VHDNKVKLPRVGKRGVSFVGRSPGSLGGGLGGSFLGDLEQLAKSDRRPNGKRVHRHPSSVELLLGRAL